MFLITHLQRAALLMFSGRMSDAMHKHGSLQDRQFHNQLTRVRQDFAQFVHRYWFSNVSNQEQPRELFEMMQRHAGTAVLHAEVMAESEMGIGEIARIVAERQQAGTLGLNVLLAAVAFLGLPLGFAQGLGALAGGKHALTLGQFYGLATLASAVAFAAILAVATLQLDGRIGPEHLRSFLFSGVHGPRHALKRMRHLVRILLGLNFVLLLTFVALLVAASVSDPPCDLKVGAALTRCEAQAGAANAPAPAAPRPRVPRSGR